MNSTFRWLVIAWIALGLVAVNFRPALADPPPWAGKWKHDGHHDRDDDDDDWWQHHDRDEWRSHHYEHRGNDARCGQILDRMQFDRSKVRQIEPTGRHRKALQWYREDIGNARNDLERCRRGN